MLRASLTVMFILRTCVYTAAFFSRLRLRTFFKCRSWGE